MPAFTAYKSMHDVSQIEIEVKNGRKDDQRYNMLRSFDDQSDSSTEVGDWEADGGTKRRPTRSKTLLRSIKRYHWVLDITLLLIILGLLVKKRWKHHHGHQYGFAGDIAGFAPTCKFTQYALKVIN